MPCMILEGMILYQPEPTHSVGPVVCHHYRSLGSLVLAGSNEASNGVLIDKKNDYFDIILTLLFYSTLVGI